MRALQPSYKLRYILESVEVLDEFGVCHFLWIFDIDLVLCIILNTQ